jgi:hypothetical protein
LFFIDSPLGISLQGLLFYPCRTITRKAEKKRLTKQENLAAKKKELSAWDNGGAVFGVWDSHERPVREWTD